MISKVCSVSVFYGISCPHMTHNCSVWFMRRSHSWPFLFFFPYSLFLCLEVLYWTRLYNSKLGLLQRKHSEPIAQVLIPFQKSKPNRDDRGWTKSHDLTRANFSYSLVVLRIQSPQSPNPPPQNLFIVSNAFQMASCGPLVSHEINLWFMANIF